MMLKQISPVNMPTLKGYEEEAVRMRLRTLCQLALAIGKREGLLDNGSGSEKNAAAKDSAG
jgi:hypothetical protein